jgi:hypothetical protein
MKRTWKCWSKAQANYKPRKIFNLAPLQLECDFPSTFFCWTRVKNKSETKKLNSCHFHFQSTGKISSLSTNINFLFCHDMK